MKKLWFYISAEWQTIILLISAFILLLGLLTFRLGSLTPGAHSSEVLFSQRSPSVSTIVKDPVDSPYLVVRNTIRKLKPQTTLTSTRLPSVLFAFVIVVAFLGLLSMWYRPRVALLGTLLFASSSWFLHSARLATPEILQALSVTLILFWAWLQRTHHPRIAFAISSLAVVSMMYIPGMIWFIFAAAVWRGKQLRQELKKQPYSSLIVCSLVSLLLAAPLLYSLFITPSIILEILGIDTAITIGSVLRQIVQIPFYLMIRGPADALVTVGRASLLDIFTTTMMIVGLYATVRTWRLDRSMLTLGLLGLGIMLSIMGNSRLLVPLLIPVYLLVTAGVAFMLEEWLRVFPRNPLARAIATTLMSIAVLTVGFYHITNYFIAWPNAPLTKTTFSKRL